MRLPAPRFNKYTKTISLVLLLVVIAFIVAPPALAVDGDWIGGVLGGVIGILISALGLILILVIKGLLIIATYQHFIDSQAVIEGWAIVRDLSNMFFVVILLVIAFSTILHLENYSYKKWLPKLILMAVLINFSKTICGLMIDVAQIIMLTFVNAFKDVAGGNIIDMLGIKSIVTMAKDTEGVGFWTIIGAYVLGLIYMVIALVVITTMMVMLAMRLVMIWIYVVLSPLAYLLSAFPGGAQYASQWWKEFVQNLIIGPVLAFFIWLSFAALQTGTDMDLVQTAGTETGNVQQEAGAIGSPSGVTNDPVAASEASTPSALIKFVIGIGMLLGGLKIAQQIGGAAGGIAGKGMGKLSKVGAFATGAVGGFALARAKGVGRGALGVTGGLSKFAGSKLGDNPLGRGLSKVGDIGLSYRRDLIAANDKKKTESRKKFLEKVGVGAGTADKFNQTFGKSRNAQGGANALTMATTGVVGGALHAGVAGAVVGGVGGLAAAAVMYGLGKWQSNLVKKAETGVTNRETDLANATTAAGGDVTHPTVVAAQQKLQEAKDKLNTRKGTSGTFKAGIYKSMDSAGSFSTKFTSAAAKKIADVEEKARQQIHGVATDGTWMKDAAPSGVYSSSGQQDHQEAFVRHLSGDGPEAAAARDNLLKSINGQHVDASGAADPTKNYDSDDKGDKAFLRALAKGIAATDKKGAVDISALSAIIAAINGKSADIGGTVNGYKDSAIPYRNTGVQGEQGQGGVYVNSFAGNKDGKDVLGADFNKLKESGVDIDASADGAFISPEMMAPVAAALIAQIQQSRIELETAHADGTVNDIDYNNRKNDFDKAEARLQTPEGIKGLSMVNTQSANFGRDARLTSAYHEQIHGAGVKDEELTENLAKSLMANKLYGRNAETGGRHANEIAVKAQEMKNNGASNPEIMRAMNAEITKRSMAESPSHAARVIQMESGQKETETDFARSASGEREKETPTIDLKSVEEKLASLEKTFKGIKFPDNGAQMAQLFRGLGVVVRKSGSKTAAALEKLPVAQASTPLEMEVIAENAK